MNGHAPFAPRCRKVIAVLMIVTSPLFVTLHAYAQHFEFKGKRKKETVSFRMVKNLMIIKLMVNGKGPFNFVLDTGVGLFLISDPRLIDSVSIKNLRSITIQGFGDGEPLSAYVAPSVKVEFANTVAENISAAILKDDMFELSNYVGMPVHGLIGYEFFNSFVVRINFNLNTLTIYRPHVIVSRKGTRVPITIEERKPYLVSDITLNSGERVAAKLIIDTGAGHPVSLESRDGKPFEIPEKNIRGNLGIGLTGPISGHLARITSLKVGRYTLHDILTAFPDFEHVGARLYSANRNGNMGLAILRRFNVVFDYNASALYLKPGSFLRTPFEHDMSGLELSSVGENYDRLLITRVEPGSPGAEAGLRENDEILSINFRSVSEISPTQVDDMFRSKTDRSFIIDVLPYGRTDIREKERVILTLRRRI